jgi:hypothetical protein
MRQWQALAVAVLLFGGARDALAQQSRITLVDDTARREFLITIGPVDLPLPAQHGQGGDGAHGGHGGNGHNGHPGQDRSHGDPHAAHAPVLPPIEEVVIPYAVYLHGFSYRIVDGHGRELSADVLHHLNVIMPDNRELFLPISQRLLAFGKETGAQSVPADEIGVPVRDGQRLTVAAMLHNPTSEAHEGVSIQVRLEYVRASDQQPHLVAYPFQMDVGFPTGDKDVDLPPGRSVFTWEGSPAIPGKILAIGGHVHEFAERVALVDATTGKELWRGLPRYDDAGKVTGVTVEAFDEDSAIVLDPSHTYRVVATYRNPTRATLYSGGMGVLGGVFLPDEGAVWPAADSSDRLYRLDRLHYLREVRGRFEQIVRVVEGGQAGARAP